WDLRKGDKCGQDVKYNLPITACAFSPDGKFLAHAIGYDWSRGPDEYYPQQMKPQLYIHQLQQVDIVAPNR
ncbi:MAG: hypothetical protein EZS28_051161, partial [Streblomastix strix]